MKLLEEPVQLQNPVMPKTPYQYDPARCLEKLKMTLGAIGMDLEQPGFTHKG
jgi:hypothetical protein